MAGDFSTRKQDARRQLESLRRSLTSHEVRLKSEEASARLLALPFFATARWVASYAPQAFELHPIGLRRPLALPRVVKGKRTLAFHAWEAQELIAGPLGLSQPATDWPVVALQDIDVFIVPGVGFARDGTRLGRGGGYYDATLEASRAVKIGFTFDCCLVDALPSDAWDVRVDWIVTESRVLQVGGRQPARSPKTQE